MAPVIPDSTKIRSFPTEAAFAAWMKANHARETEVWLKIHKKSSGLPTVTTTQALDVALCWGWIDGIRKSFDEQSFLQRYTPRRARSIWSQLNRNHVARLTAAGRMTPHGQRQVDAAKADGRWAAAYAPMRDATKATIPEDLLAAIDVNPKARKTFRTLSRLNLFALAFRTNNMKTPAGRARKIAALVETLARGETIVPERLRTANATKPRAAKAARSARGADDDA
ncbi:MAG: YdeI/OmpD-associated family protein [Acidobacteriota bacterium]